MGDYAGTGLSGSPFALSPGALGGAAALGGLGYLLASGPSPLPQQFQQVQGYSPQEYATGRALTAAGGPLLATGTAGLQAAQQGTLTPEQQAQLSQLRTTETNQAMQMYSSMGRTPTKDTSFLGTEQAIDANLLAAAQNFVTTNIQLAVSTIQAGISTIGEGLQFESAASQNLIAAGNAQAQLDKDYSDSISSAFKAIGTMFGAAMLSDVRVKRDVGRIGQLTNGIKVYRFRYRWSDTYYVGVIAQDVMQTLPDAVMRDDHGYLHVNYGRLGDLGIIHG